MRAGNLLTVGAVVALAVGIFLSAPVGVPALSCSGGLGSGACVDQSCTQYSATTGACVSTAAPGAAQACAQYSATTGACVAPGTTGGAQTCAQYSATTGACVAPAATGGAQTCAQYSATTGACVAPAAGAAQTCAQYSATTGACVAPAGAATPAASCATIALQAGQTCANGVVSCQAGAIACTTPTAAAGAAAHATTCTTYSATTGACVSNSPAATGAPAAASGPGASVTINTSYVASGGQQAQPPGGSAAGATFAFTPSAGGGQAISFTSNSSGQATGTLPAGDYSFQETSPPSGTTFLSASLSAAAPQPQSLTPGLAVPYAAGASYTITVVNQVAGGQAGGTATVTVYNSLTGAGGQPATGSRGGFSLTLNGQNGLPLQTVVTNELGQATFSNVPPGIYSLSQTAPAGATFASMSINGDPAQLQQSFQLQAGGNYEIDITNQAGSGTAAAATGGGTGCPSGSAAAGADDRLWEQACPILPSVVTSSNGSAPASPAPVTRANTISSGTATGSGSISVGTLVQVSGTGDGLNVRSSPTTSAGIVTSLSDGSTATITGGPQSADGYTWWELDTGGWSVSQYLSPASGQGSGG